MPRASFRSLLFTCALRKALAWRVSMQMAGTPASANPLNSHCDRGPASSPTRSIRHAGSQSSLVRSQWKSTTCASAPSHRLSRVAESTVRSIWQASPAARAHFRPEQPVPPPRHPLSFASEPSAGFVRCSKLDRVGFEPDRMHRPHFKGGSRVLQRTRSSHFHQRRRAILPLIKSTT